MTDTAPRTVKVRNVIDDAKIKADASYTTANMTDAFQQQAGLYVEYATYAARASRQVDDLKLLLEVKESVAFRAIRDQAATKGAKITDKGAEYAVSTHPDVIAVKRALNEAKQIEAIAKGALEALKQKRDMLIQQGADGRQERKGELRMNGLEDQKERMLARIQGKEE